MESLRPLIFALRKSGTPRIAGNEAVALEAAGAEFRRKSVGIALVPVRIDQVPDLLTPLRGKTVSSSLRKVSALSSYQGSRRRAGCATIRDHVFRSSQGTGLREPACKGDRRTDPLERRRAAGRPCV